MPPETGAGIPSRQLTPSGLSRTRFFSPLSAAMNCSPVQQALFNAKTCPPGSGARLQVKPSAETST